MQVLQLGSDRRRRLEIAVAWSVLLVPGAVEWQYWSWIQAYQLLVFRFCSRSEKVSSLVPELRSWTAGLRSCCGCDRRTEMTRQIWSVSPRMEDQIRDLEAQVASGAAGYGVGMDFGLASWSSLEQLAGTYVAELLAALT